MFLPAEITASLPSTLRQRIQMGFDVAQVSSVAHSLAEFGDRYLRRLFTPAEIAYAFQGVGLQAERLAARFAAKEAVMKALQLSEAGVDWRDIEVVKHPDGSCGVALHGEAARCAQRAGAEQIVLSLSHDGDCAGAVAVAVLASPRPEIPLSTSHENR